VAGEKTIKRVEAHEGADWVYRIDFLAADGSIVHSYNHGNSSNKVTAFDIGSNEELIGVYGVKDKSNYFTSFGFIVKVKTYYH